MFDFSFILLLGLVGTGSRWRDGVGYLPPGHSAAGKTGKTGILGADGEPDISKDGKQLTAAEKAEIAKRDKEARDRELGIETKPSIPNLKGSEKQVAWAEKIRESKIKLFDTYKSNIDSEIAKLEGKAAERASKGRDPAFYDKKIESLKSDKALVEEFAPQVAKSESASFWIDNFKGSMYNAPAPGFKLGEILSEAQKKMSRY